MSKFFPVSQKDIFPVSRNFSLCHSKIACGFPVWKSKNQIPCLVTLKFNGGSVKIVNKSRILPIEALWIYYLQIYKSPGKVTQIYLLSGTFLLMSENWATFI